MMNRIFSVLPLLLALGCNGGEAPDAGQACLNGYDCPNPEESACVQVDDGMACRLSPATGTLCAPLSEQQNGCVCLVGPNSQFPTAPDAMRYRICSDGFDAGAPD